MEPRLRPALVPAEQPASGLSAAEVRSIGAEVIRTEARALEQVAEALDGQFDEAVRLLSSASGRVIVSGLGKSGHIARKVAATLASTGTPALFVHSAEACHGDLGMITAGDLLILMSNSGATPELRAIIDHGRRHDCTIIAIASRTTSPLMRAADVALTLPQAREACPVNIAPTTSTTMMLALGDALAIAAMRVRGLSRDTLRALHPGGAIGSRLMPVDNVMHAAAKLPLVGPNDPMNEVVIEMSRKGFGIAGVADGGTLIGVITDGDLRRHSADLFQHHAGEVMTTEPKTVAEGTSCEEALAVMEQHGITALFVTACDAPRRPIGLVHIHDLARLQG
jgi:arabinose-5-phosphate isomerase